MRSMFALLLLVHAGVHVLAFLGSWGLARPGFPAALRRVPAGSGANASSTLLLGACWLVVAAAIAVAGVTAFSAPIWWPAYTAATLLCSLVLTLLEWDTVPAGRVGGLVDVTMLAMLWTSHLLDLLL